MFIKKIPLILFLLSLFLSCKKARYEYHLAFDDNSKFVISLDSLTPPDTRMIQFFDSDKNYSFRLAMLNFDNQVINLHDGTGKKISEIDLVDLDSTSSKISGFHFIDNDSLLIYSENSRNLKLISCRKKFTPVLVFNLDSLQNDKIGQLDIRVTSKTPILFENDVIYLTGRAMLHNPITSPQTKQVVSAFSFNLKTKKVDFIPMFSKIWEERYWHHEQYFVNHTFIPKQHKIIYSLAMKDYVTTYDTQNTNQTQEIMVSQELGSEKDMVPKTISDPSNIGSYDDLMQYLDKPRYGEIIFDKYRDIYYRFVTSGNEKRETYLIIYNKNLKKIGETELPENYLSGAGFFLVKDGIFLRKSEIQGQDEDKIVFNLFKLKKS